MVAAFRCLPLLRHHINKPLFKKFFLQEDGSAIAQQRKHNCGTTMQQSVRIRDTKKEEKNREDARQEKQNAESVGE
jgi:hypothetical protein